MKATLQQGPLVAGGRLATVHRGMLDGRAVAVKRARCGVAGAAAALRREARVLGAARHVALVPVLDFVDDPDEPALVLGWADGGSLADLLADGPVDDEVVLHVIRPVAGALEALHRAGMAHLDVSPRNILLAAAGPVLIDPAPPGAGTPGYTDPSMAGGGPPSARSDVFGLAGCAHLALTGRSPRTGGGAAVGLLLTPALAATLAAALHPDPRERPATPSAFVDQLEAALRPVAVTRGRGEHQAPGRPVVRRRDPVTYLPRTWPFERWQEEVDDAAARRPEVAQEASPPRCRHRRRRRSAVLAVAVIGAIGAVAWLLVGAPAPATPFRPSAHDSTPRPPVTRPPPTTPPGGRP